MTTNMMLPAVRLVTSYNTIGSARYQLRADGRIVFESKSEKLAIRALANLWCPARLEVK